MEQQHIIHIQIHTIVPGMLVFNHKVKSQELYDGNVIACLFIRIRVSQYEKNNQMIQSNQKYCTKKTN